MLRYFYLKDFVFKIKHYICSNKLKNEIMKEYEIEFHFRYGNDRKDFDIEKIQAESFADAVRILKNLYEGRIWIFKTEMKSEKDI